jgi:hypothetical protein
LKGNKRPAHRMHRGSHKPKTLDEREAYNERVKFAPATGETVPPPQSRTSTLSERSVYARESGAGIPDRDPIRPPKEKERGLGPSLTMVGGILTIAVALVGVVIFITTLKNKVDFNEKSIDQLSTSFREADSKREELGDRITKLEQWKDVFSRDLGELQRDMNSGVSNEQLEIKLRDLERRIHEQIANK